MPQGNKMIVEIESQADPIPPSKEQMKADFLRMIKENLKQEAMREKQFVEGMEAMVWDSGVQIVQAQNGARVAIPVSLTPEEKIECLNDDGIAVDLFSAGSAVKETAMKYVGGLVFAEHPNKKNYDFGVIDGKVVITKK